MSLPHPGFTESPLAGMDFSWPAVDRDGHVAWLVTFGSAVVPKWVEEDRDLFDDVEVLLKRLPERGGRAGVDSSRFTEQWRAAARAGLFAYDWEVYRGPYRLIAAPEVPVKVEALPPELARLAERTRFAQLCFCTHTELTAYDVLAAERGAPLPRNY